MSLFPERPERPRIAAFVGYEFPVAEEAPLYDQLDELGGMLAAEWRVFHAVCGDPRPLPLALRARIGTGLFVPQAVRMHRNDVEHFRSTLAARTDDLIDTLAQLGECSRAAIFVRPQLQAAFGHARWLRAWSPDLVISFGLEEASFQALIGSWLLELPWCLVLDSPDGVTEYARLLPLHVRHADLVVATNRPTHDALRSSFGDALDDRLVLAEHTAAWPRAAGEHLRRLVTSRRSDGAVALGPRAAFVTHRLPPPAPATLPARPFLVLGAERTGSNLLVGMLESVADVRCGNELFNPRSIADGVVHWLDGASRTEPDILQLRLADPAGLHHRLLRAGADRGASLVGFKLLHYHGLIDDRVVDHLVSLTTMPVVHLTRRDRLRRYVSLARAQGSDRWYEPARAAPAVDGPPSPQAAPGAGEPLRLAIDDAIAIFELSELFEERYRAIFRDHAMLELDYEELANERARSTERLEALLRRPLGPMQPRSRKTGSTDLSRAVANLDELRAAIAGTRWQTLLPDEEQGDE